MASGLLLKYHGPESVMKLTNKNFLTPIFQLRHGTKECQYSPDEGVIRLQIRGRQVNLVCPSSQLDSYSIDKVFNVKKRLNLIILFS